MVGDQMLDCVAKRYQVLDTLSTNLNAPHLYLDSALAQVIGNTHVLHEKIGTWKKRYEIAVSKELMLRHETVIVEELDDVERSSAISIVRNVIEQGEKAVVLIARKYDSVCVVCGASQEVDFDYAKLYNELAENFRLKGGCEAQLMYGEGIYKEAIATYCKEFIK
jgi:alanyl-tRNA synthetase